MWVQWTEQREYMDKTWGCGWHLATLFIIINLLGQLGPAGMVLFRSRVRIGCGLLIFNVCLQTVAYNYWDFQFLCPNLAVVGALLLVLAESRTEARTLFTGVSGLGEIKSKDCLQLTGRILLVFVFVPLLRFEGPTLEVMLNLFGSALMILVTIGYKTKPAASVLAAWLFILNVYFNAWWNVPGSELDAVKYVFFQCLAVIGGLLLVVSLGPGAVSVDGFKKKVGNLSGVNQDWAL